MNEREIVDSLGEDDFLGAGVERIGNIIRLSNNDWECIGCRQSIPALSGIDKWYTADEAIMQTLARAVVEHANCAR